MHPPHTPQRGTPTPRGLTASSGPCLRGQRHYEPVSVRRSPHERVSLMLVHVVFPIPAPLPPPPPCSEVDVNQDGVLQFDEFKELLLKVGPVLGLAGGRRVPCPPAHAVQRTASARAAARPRVAVLQHVQRGRAGRVAADCHGDTRVSTVRRHWSEEWGGGELALQLMRSVPCLSPPPARPLSLACDQMCADQFGDTLEVRDAWAAELFDDASSLSDTGEVNCDLFVSVVQGTLQPGSVWAGQGGVAPPRVCGHTHVQSGTRVYAA